MAFPGKVIRDIDFTNEVVVQCDVPDVKKKKNFGMNTYGWLMYLYLYLYIVLISSEIEAYNGLVCLSR